MKTRNNNVRLYSAYSIVLGLLYVALGALDVLTGFGLLHIAFIPPDVIGGIMLIIVGVVFLHVARPITKGDIDGIAFLHVGVLLAGILFGLQIIVIITNGLGWIAGLEDWAEWSITLDITPSLWLFFLVLPLATVMHQKRRKTRHDRIR